MSFVIEAIGRATSGWREYRTEECVVSSTSAAVERSVGSASAARLAYFKCAGTAVAAGAACETEAANDRHTSAVSPRKRP